jgi:hypothetical protein
MKHPADWKILASLGFLVATVAVPTVVSLISNDVTEMSSGATAKMTVADASREPASVSSANGIHPHIISFDVRCATAKKFSFIAEGAYVQLHGKDCSKRASETPLSITNKTNGFTASIFEVSKNEYQTDFIQLKAGENQISIRFQTPAGTVEEDVLQIQSDEI